MSVKRNWYDTVNFFEAGAGTDLKIPNKVISEILFLLFLSLAVVWCVKTIWARRWLYYYSWNIPGPMSLPIVGSAHHFILNLDDILGTVRKLANKYPGGVFRLWVGTKLYYAITEPKYLEILLTNQNSLGKADDYKVMELVVRKGLFTAPVQVWKRNRKMISPAFNQKALDQFVEIFVQNSVVLVEEMKKYCGKKSDDIDLLHIIQKCTMDIICESAMGTKVNAQTTNCQYLMWSDRGMEIIMKRIFNIFYHNDMIFSLTPLGKELNQIVKNMNNFALKVINEKKVLYQNRKKNIEENTENCFHEEKDARKKALVDYLIELSENEDRPFTDEELLGEVNTFIIAGSDTTATTICFTMTVLGMYQDVQQKVYEEILDVLGPDKPVEYSDLPNLKYLERVIKETTRLFSVPSIAGRRVASDINLGNIVLPKDSTAMLIFFHCHVNPKYWPDPYKFDPDRFLPEEVAKRPPCAYLPFSYGPRNCIGMKYALMSMKAMFATVLRKYKFFTDYKSIEEIGLKANLVLRATDGYKVRFQLRD